MNEDNDGAHIVGPPLDPKEVLHALEIYTFGMPRWRYRLRFILAGVRLLGWRCWLSPSAWRAVADDFDNGSDEQHEGYSPKESAVESLSYWDAD